jgi:asparagine synthase (glutamine-hydrolysing)
LKVGKSGGIMSAIVGIYHMNNEPVSSEQGLGMMKALAKFPADDIQVWKKENIFLGCHAQWITPESVGEQLPYYDDQRQLAITADAIIDNRDELFSMLGVDYADRKTMPDSQLILLAYSKWGEETPKYLVGDFAFMIWDEREHKVFGARDPSGGRTLYYFLDEKHFLFSTTIEPLLTLPYIKKGLNEEWLAEYLVITGMIDTAGARTTPFLDIDQIPPFHSITIKQNNIKISRNGYFYTGKKLKLKNDEEYVEAFQEVFQKAVNSRLRTFRNVGSHLSGGLDSGSVVGFARKKLKDENKQLHTFSYIPTKDFVDFTSTRLMPDESPFIKKVVDYVGGIHDHYCDFEGISSYTEIDKMLDVNEMPYKFIENSFWLKGTFENASAQDVGILLNGDFGNASISWGNALYFYAKLLKRLKWFRLLQELNMYSRNVGGARFRNVPIIARVAFPAFTKSTEDHLSEAYTRVINADFAKKTGIYEKLEDYGIDQSGWLTKNDLNEQRKWVFENIFPANASNTFYSKLSLKYKTWKRDPTNDLRVVQFCLAVPDEQYVKNGMDRALIRRATENILPDEIRLNQKVRGVQAADWIHRMVPDWKNFINEGKQLSEDNRILGYFDDRAIRSALAKCEEGPVREDISNGDYRTLIRSIVIYRYLLKNFF